MPLKWKIYYACNIYYLLWSIYSFIFSAAYAILYMSGDFWDWLLFFVPLIIMSKPLVSIKLFNHYKNKTVSRAWEVILFVVLFMVNIIYTISMIILLCEEIFAKYGASDLFDIIMKTPFVIFIISSFYTILLDMPLKHLVTKYHNEDISGIMEKPQA